jgi:hypothetical protein
MKISFWQEDNKTIKINIGKQEGITGITSVNSNETSVRGNPHMFNQLKQILINEGKWDEDM